MTNNDRDDNDRHATAMRFAASFLERGLEFCVRGNRLRLWPWKSWPWLTDAEREFITSHRDELKEIATSKRLGETSVVWVPPDSPIGDPLITDPGQDSRAPDFSAAKTRTPTTTCPYCLRKCVGRGDRWYRIFHWADPEQVAKRHAEATAEMLHQVGRP